MNASREGRTALVIVAMLLAAWAGAFAWGWACKGLSWQQEGEKHSDQRRTAPEEERPSRLPVGDTPREIIKPVVHRSPPPSFASPALSSADTSLAPMDPKDTRRDTLDK